MPRTHTSRACVASSCMATKRASGRRRGGRRRQSAELRQTTGPELHPNPRAADLPPPLSSIHGPFFDGRPSFTLSPSLCTGHSSRRVYSRAISSITYSDDRHLHTLVGTVGVLLLVHVADEDDEEHQHAHGRRVVFVSRA